MRHYNGQDPKGRHSWFVYFEGSWMECYDYAEGAAHGYTTGLGFVEDIATAEKIGRAFADAAMETYKNYDQMLKEMIK